MFDDNKIKISLILGLLAPIAAAGSLGAADFPARLGQEELSINQGFEAPRVLVLERIAGPGKEAVAETLLARFAAPGASVTTSGAFTQDVNESRVAVTGDAGWALKVYADGTRVSYRNLALMESRPELHVPVAERLSETKLEALGRSFLDQYLDGLVQTTPNEELMPFFTEFAIRGAAAVDGSGERQEDRVSASAVVFTRTVAGVPVVGPGSKVAVIFANDGTPVGFDLDWASYQPRGDDQEVLAVDSILDRSRVLAELEGFPEEPVIEHFECGYYDAGARRKDPTAPIQAGCFLQAKQRRGEFLVARAEAIPAGREVEPDQGWPETLTLVGLPSEQGGEVGTSPPSP
jgi:hypothetical protein